MNGGSPVVHGCIHDDGGDANMHIVSPDVPGIIVAVTESVVGCCVDGRIPVWHKQLVLYKILHNEGETVMLLNLTLYHPN